MLMQIELLDLHKEYCDVMKWVSIRSRVKNQMLNLENKKARNLAIEIYDKLDDICDILESDLTEHDKNFEKKLIEEYK